MNLSITILADPAIRVAAHGVHAAGEAAGHAAARARHAAQGRHEPQGALRVAPAAGRPPEQRQRIVLQDSMLEEDSFLLLFGFVLKELLFYHLLPNMFVRHSRD